MRTDMSTARQFRRTFPYCSGNTAIDNMAVVLPCRRMLTERRSFHVEREGKGSQSSSRMRRDIALAYSIPLLGWYSME